MTECTRGHRRDSRVLLLLALLSASILGATFGPDMGASSPDNFPVTFLFHRQASKTINQIPATTMWANTTRIWSSVTQTENRDVRNTLNGVWVFYTQPVLPGNLAISGAATYSIWFSSSSNTGPGTTIQTDLVEVSPSGVRTTLGSSSRPQEITTSTLQYSFTTTSLSATVPTGYILGFQVTVMVTGGTTRTVTLHFDTSARSSRATLDVTDHINTSSIRYYNSSIVLTSSFSRNWTDRQVVALADVSDSMGLYDVSQVTLTVLNPAGLPLVNQSSMTRISGLPTSYSGIWQLTFPYSENDTSGVYTGQTSVLDLSNNTRVSAQFSFRIFAWWPLNVSVLTAPPSSTPLENVQIRILDGATVLLSSTTSSQGTVATYLKDDKGYDIEAVWQGTNVARMSNFSLTGAANVTMNLQVYLFQFANLFRDGDGRTLDSPVSSFTVTAPNGSVVNPNPTGSYFLQAGSFQVNSVLWKGIDVTPSAASFNPSTASNIRLRVYDLSLIVTDEQGRSLADAQVTAVSLGTTIASGTTDSTGFLYFRQIPAGEYAVNVQHPSGTFTRSITVDKTDTVSLQFAPPPEPPAAFLSLQMLGLIAGSSIGGLGGFFAYRRFLGPRLKFKEVGFEYLNSITGGGIPAAATLLVTGDSGSGKTLLSEQVAGDWLKKGKPCVYITYGSQPNDIRKRMDSLGIRTKSLESANKLVFIDCYSAQAKVKSSEKYNLERPFDLTDLGINLTQAIKDVGEKEPMIIVEPLSDLFSKVTPIVVVNFLQDKGAKIKGLGGNLVFTVGRGAVPKELAGNVDALADGIIDLSTAEGKAGITRSLRVKKMRNQSFLDGVFNFRIRTSKGIRFLVKRGFP